MRLKKTKKKSSTEREAFRRLNSFIVSQNFRGPWGDHKINIPLDLYVRRTYGLLQWLKRISRCISLRYASLLKKFRFGLPKLSLADRESTRIQKQTQNDNINRRKLCTMFAQMKEYCS